jgi:hypothetical protein
MMNSYRPRGATFNSNPLAFPTIEPNSAPGDVGDTSELAVMMDVISRERRNSSVDVGIDE